jgi:hypothetical protein
MTMSMTTVSAPFLDTQRTDRPSERDGHILGRSRSRGREETTGPPPSGVARDSSWWFRRFRFRFRYYYYYFYYLSSMSVSMDSTRRRGSDSREQHARSVAWCCYYYSGALLLELCCSLPVSNSNWKHRGKRRKPTETETSTLLGNPMTTAGRLWRQGFLAWPSRWLEARERPSIMVVMYSLSWLWGGDNNIFRGVFSMEL